jgi:hypothetical protein
VSLFDLFLNGVHFTVETDHHSLKWLKEATTSQRLVRWALRLADYDFSIVHKAGKTNANADALSRLPRHDLIDSHDSDVSTDNMVMHVTSIHGEGEQTVEFAQRNDPDLQALYDSDDENKVVDVRNYVIIDRLLYRKVVVSGEEKNVLMVPTSLIEKVLTQYHVEVGAHMSSNRMVKVLKERFYWNRMHTDVTEYVAACEKCVRHKSVRNVHDGLLQPIVVRKSFEIVGIDIKGPFKVSNGYKYVLVMIDLFTGWVEVVPLRSLTANEVCQGFFSGIVLLVTARLFW